MFHRRGFADDFAAFGAHGIAGSGGVVHFYGDVSIACAEVVGWRVPIVGEFQHGGVAFFAVAHKRQREAPIWVVFAAQQFHVQHFGVKRQRFVQIAHAQHGVE